MSEEVKSFNLDLGEIPFELVNRKTKEVTRYILVELDGVQRDEHMEALRAKSNISPDGKTMTVKTFKGVTSGLLAKCIHRSNPDGTPGELVPEETILSWPAKTLDTLHELATELSGLGKEDDEDDKSKNGSTESDSSGSSSPTA